VSAYWTDIHGGLGLLLLAALMLGGWALLWWLGTRDLRVIETDDPIGWDERAQRVHDVEPLRGGRLLHHSTCWCRGGQE
jgi:hypothetical protein